MPQNTWIARWESGRIGFHQSTVHPQLEAHANGLKSLNEAPRVLVPLCGKSLDMVFLRDQGCDVVGIELAEIAARDFFNEANIMPEVTSVGPFSRWSGEGIEILCGDFFKATPEITGPIHAAYDRAAIVALPPSLRASYAQQLASLLPPHAPLLLIGFDYPQEAMAGPPFSVPKPDVEQLLSADFDIHLLSELDILDSNPKFKDRVPHLREQTYLLRRR